MAPSCLSSNADAVRSFARLPHQRRPQWTACRPTRYFGCFCEPKLVLRSHGDLAELLLEPPPGFAIMWGKGGCPCSPSKSTERTRPQMLSGPVDGIGLSEGLSCWGRYLPETVQTTPSPADHHTPENGQPSSAAVRSCAESTAGGTSGGTVRLPSWMDTGQRDVSRILCGSSAAP